MLVKIDYYLLYPKFQQKALRSMHNFSLAGRVKVVLVACALLNVSCFTSKNGNSIRTDAIKQILASTDLSRIGAQPEGYRVCEELIPFYDLGFSFLDHLPANLFSEDDFALNLLKNEVVIDTDIAKLASDPKSPLQLCFSQIVHDYFVIEVFNTRDNITSRSSIPDTGQSMAYLFKIKEGKAFLKSKQLINYG